ncbi:MAG: CynX/NimT family MFS transporter [Burkholderiaceae bacterium]
MSEPHRSRAFGIDPSVLVVLAGVSAALHVGKLPPAIPVLRDALGITLVQAGFLLSLVQLAGMTLGLLVGVMADGVGLKRTLIAGLALLSAASAMGAAAMDASSLLAWRAVEGAGFLLASLPGPALIRRLVEPARLHARLGLWGTYMPLGTALALLLGPLAIAAWGWPAWWGSLSALSALMALALAWALPADVRAAHPQPMQAQPASTSPTDTERWWQRLAQTLLHRGPWLVALAFAVYSAQWLAVIGFLPSIYAQAGVAAAQAGVLTALAAAVNMLGNLMSGRLLQRGFAPRQTMTLGFVAMALGALLAFAELGQGAAWRYLGVILFSTIGGLIPGTLFSTAVRLAPGERTVSSTVGFMQQLSALGQFTGPPVVAWVASRVGGWQWTWAVTGALALLGLLLTQVIHAELHRRSVH